jgi:hypothetical protein
MAPLSYDLLCAPQDVGDGEGGHGVTTKARSARFFALYLLARMHSHFLHTRYPFAVTRVLSGVNS